MSQYHWVVGLLIPDVSKAQFTFSARSFEISGISDFVTQLHNLEDFNLQY
jgi:hypothetical protein